MYFRFLDTILCFLWASSYASNEHESHEDRTVLVSDSGRLMLAPMMRIGEVIQSSSSKRSRYRLTEFVRIQGDKPFTEVKQQSPVFFTPALSGESPLLLAHLPQITDESGGELATVATDDWVRGSWRLKQRTSRGAHGEVWRATRVPFEGGVNDDGGSDDYPEKGYEDSDNQDSDDPEDDDDDDDDDDNDTVYVLKRMLLEKGESVALAAAREIHFGKSLNDLREHLSTDDDGDTIFQDEDHVDNEEQDTIGGGSSAPTSVHLQVARFVESFVSRNEATGLDELWLVFVDEGRSVHEWLYTPHDLGGFPSSAASSQRSPSSTEKAPSNPSTTTTVTSTLLPAAAAAAATRTDLDSSETRQDASSGLGSKSRKNDESRNSGGCGAGCGSQSQTPSMPPSPLPPSSPSEPSSVPTAGVGAATVLLPSASWRLLRESEQGRSLVQELMRQIFETLSVLSTANITHRDIKSSNVVWGLKPPRKKGKSRRRRRPRPMAKSRSPRDSAPGTKRGGDEKYEDGADNDESSRDDDGGFDEKQPRLYVALIDFSSAYSQEALALGLFGVDGPSADDETREAMPPERVFASTFSSSSSSPSSSSSKPSTSPGPTSSSWSDSSLVPSPSFDTWSVGVLLLELLLGTRSVFTVDQRSRALLSWEYRGAPPEDLERALFAAALSDFCIRPTPSSDTSNFSSNGRDSDQREGNGTVFSTTDANKTDPQAQEESDCNFKGENINMTSSGDNRDTGNTSKTLLPNENPDHNNHRRKQRRNKRGLPRRNYPQEHSRCGAEELSAALLRRDPLEIGYDSMLGRDGVDFLAAVLRWDPTDRLTPAQALQHSFLRQKGSAGCGHDTAASRLNPNNDGAHKKNNDGKEYGRRLNSHSWDDAETSEASRQQDKLHAVLMNSISDNLLSPLSDSSAFKLDRGYQEPSSSQCSSLPAPPLLSSSSSPPSSQFSMSDKFDFGPYRCPSCNRTFNVYASCLRHATARGHSLWCNPTAHEHSSDEDHHSAEHGPAYNNEGNDYHSLQLSSQTESQLISSPLALVSSGSAREEPAATEEVLELDESYPSQLPSQAVSAMTETSIATGNKVLPIMLPAPPRLLPPCLSSHALLPVDPLSGWCDVQGRRQYIEDHFAIVYTAEYSLWSVFDGHLGASAAQFAAHYLPPAMARHVNLTHPTKEQVRTAFLDTDAALLRQQALQRENAAVMQHQLVVAATKEDAGGGNGNDKGTEKNAAADSTITNSENVEFRSVPSHTVKNTKMGWLKKLLLRPLPSSRTASSRRVNNRRVGVVDWEEEGVETAAAKATGSESAAGAMPAPSSGSGDSLREAGTTATVALITRAGMLVVANVGDSRAVLCCGPKGEAVVLSRDHVASDPLEAARVVSLGGRIVQGSDDDDDDSEGDEDRAGGKRRTKQSKRGGSSGTARLNGKLAVTRSLGDRPFKPFTTAEPHTTILTIDNQQHVSRGQQHRQHKQHMQSSCSEEDGDICVKETSGGGSVGGDGNGGDSDGYGDRSEALFYEFLVVATDGLWDVMSSDEVVAYVKARRRMLVKGERTHEEEEFSPSPSQISWQEVAAALTHEALLRGSLDNIGVCVIDLGRRFFVGL